MGGQDRRGPTQDHDTELDYPRGEVRIPEHVLQDDAVYESLAHPRRRYLCYTLLEDAEWSLTELAEKVAAWEFDAREDELTDRERDRVYVSLYHAHVPKLVDVDVVEFDSVSETITKARNADRVLAALKGIGSSLDSAQESHARSDIDDQ